MTTERQVARPQEHPAHGALYRAEPAPVEATIGGTIVSTVRTAREEWVNRLKLSGPQVFPTMLTVASKHPTGTA
jgi:hypothetical protein